MLQVVGTPSDPQQAARGRTRCRTGSTSGAHRIDRDQDGQYDHANAIQIMDAWWPRAAGGRVQAGDGRCVLRRRPRRASRFDNEPNNHGDHLGSAYQDGWWGYVSKDLRRVLGQPVSDGFSRTYCGSGSLTACRDALRQALSDALAVPASTLYDEDPARPARSAWTQCPAGKSDQWCFDSVRFRPIGAVTVPHDPLDQPPDLPAGRRDPGPPRARLPAAEGREPAARVARARLPGLHLTQPRSTAAARVRLVQPARAALGPPHGRHARRERQRAPTRSGSMRFGVFPGNPSTPRRRGRRERRRSASPTCAAAATCPTTPASCRPSRPCASPTATTISPPAAATTRRPCPTSRSRPRSRARRPRTPRSAQPARVNTTFDALMPGAVKESDRSIWQLGAVQVFDGGADGLASTSPNTLFARQGVFVP